MLDLIEILKLSHMLAFILIVQLVEVVHGLFSDGFMEDKNLRQAPHGFPHSPAGTPLIGAWAIGIHRSNLGCMVTEAPFASVAPC